MSSIGAPATPPSAQVRPRRPVHLQPCARGARARRRARRARPDERRTRGRAGTRGGQAARAARSRRPGSAYRPPTGHELVVRARLHEPAAIEHGDPVGVAHRRQPVGDGDGRAPAGQLVERPLQRPLGGGVERRGGLVEHEHRRVAQDRARHGQPLLLTTGEPVTARTHDRLEPVGQRGDEVGDLRRGQRRPQLALGGGRAARAAGCRAPTRARGSSPATPHPPPTPARRGRGRARRCRRRSPGRCRGRAAGRAAPPPSTCPSRSARPEPASTPPAPTA